MNICFLIHEDESSGQSLPRSCHPATQDDTRMALKGMKMKMHSYHSNDDIIFLWGLNFVAKKLFILPLTGDHKFHLSAAVCLVAT